MNVRKSTDYSAMYVTLDALVAADLPQMELYCEIGRLVSGRPEKGAAVAAAEYLSTTYPDAAGFSPRNLRRMRDLYRAYADIPEVMEEAMDIGWTQNIVILEADLTPQQRAWYIRAVRRFGWSKAELQRQIDAGAHRENDLDFGDEMCYTEDTSSSEEEIGDKNRTRKAMANQVRCHWFRGNRLRRLFPHPQEADFKRNRLHRQNGPPDYVYRLHQPGHDLVYRHGRRQGRSAISVCTPITPSWLSKYLPG